MAGLEFSIMNSTSSMSLGVENPMVSGRKMKRRPVMTIRMRQIKGQRPFLSKSWDRAQ